MAIGILIIAFVIETAFAAYCIITKSSQKKVRNLARIGALAVLVILALTSVVEWSFRWYGLAALLFIWAVLGVWSLVSKKEDKKAYQSGRIIGKAIFMVLLAAIALIPAFVFPEHKIIDTTGEFTVATTSYTYTDENRIETYTDTGENRKVNVEFWYPEETDGTYPLIVFSHGATGIKTSNESLYNELASHGYVVCSIDHPYQALSTTDADGNRTWMDMGYLQELKAEDAKSDKPQSYAYYQKWMKIRTGDINFVIDHILAEAKRNDAETAYRLIDTEKIGVMGHSLGGSAALGIGRIRDDVSAVIALESPFMYDIQGVKDNEFIFTGDKYPVPVLNVYSDSSWSHLSEWAQYAENFSLLSDKDENTFNVHIRGVGHLDLTDLALTSPFFTRILSGQKSETDPVYCLKTINQLSLEFFDRYLKGEGEFTPSETW